MSELRDLLHSAYGELTTLRADYLELSQHAHQLLQKVTHMASIHDQVKQTLTDTDSLVDKLIAAKEDSDAQNADLLTQAQATQAKVKAAVEALTAPSAL